MKSIRTIENRFCVATVTKAASITEATTGRALARTDKAAQAACPAIGSRMDISGEATAPISAGERDRWNGSFLAQSRECDRETAFPGPENAEGLDHTIDRISYTATNLPGEINLDTMPDANQTEGLSGNVYRLLIRNDTGEDARSAGLLPPGGALTGGCYLSSRRGAASDRPRLLSMLSCTLGHPFFN